MAVILPAEGEEQTEFHIWKLLKAAGFTVLTAGHGEAALVASRNYPGPVDLLLTDIEMPGMGGLALCEKISEERPGIKVLTMPRHFREREQVSMSGLPFIQKPFTPTALRDSIETLLGRIPSRNQVAERLGDSESNLLRSNSREKRLIEHTIGGPVR